jgi:hypothetical protein
MLSSAIKMKLKITKVYSLASFGEEWKDCYLKFNTLTVRDITGEFSTLKDIDIKNPDQVGEGMEKVMKLLKSHYIEGKVIEESGKLVELGKDDLIDLPLEIITGVLGFLSQSSAGTSQTQ